MQQFSGYDVREKLYSSGNKTVLRVRRERDGLLGVLKYFEADARSHAEIGRINNEFNCLKAVKSPHVIRVHDLVFFERGVGILMDDFRGESLAKVLRRRHKFDARTVVDVAIKLTSGLRDIHREKVIHRDIKPSNVLLDETSGDLKIIDFGVSNAFSTSQAGEQMGSLPYMSPEQTGKMNRSVDLRSDLYSLGVLFHELLTGSCPFASEDPLELVHWHIARMPQAPSEHDASIPPFLSAIVLKLLRKEAESRYQSAAGVLADLEICRSYLERGQELPADLAVGTRDQQQIFRIPEKLYGRQVEIQRLLHRFSRAAAGMFEPVLVAGYSGIGKSALINELQKPLVAARGFFAAGKYDQFNKAKPYSAIQPALSELVRVVLRQSEAEIADWREDLLRALGGEGQCLIDVVPMLETLIGAQPALPDAGPVSRQNRFNRNCDALLRVFATAEHPLVLFLDDMQWADSASLELVRSWLDKEAAYTMLVLAYRDNEVGPHHPLTIMLRDALKERAEDCRIELSPIGQAHAEELVADTLQRTVDEVRGLAAVHMAKTGGNPFFLIQMFRGLYQDGLISFGPEGWTWDLDKITARDLTDNVVELMARKLHRYSDSTGSVLNMSAILGAEFALHRLATVLETSDETAYQALLPAIEDGLLTEARGWVKFAHDKILEASYGLVDEAESKRRHRLVGRHMLETLDEAALENQLFKVVEDLNRSCDLAETQEERQQLIRLNVRAGRKALASAAFVPSMELFETATSMLPDSAWRTDTDLAFDAYYGLACATYACAQFDKCEQSVAACFANVHDPIRTSPVVQLLLDTYFSQNRHSEGVAMGLERVRALGVKLPVQPRKVDVVKSYLAFKLRQGFRSTESLVDLPAATDKRAIAAISVLSAMIPSSYMVNGDLMGLVALQMARLSLRYGNTPYSPYGYAACMLLEAAIFKAIQSGEGYLRLAFAVHEKYPHAQERGRIVLVRSAFSRHQTRSLNGWEQEVMATVTANLDVGSVNYADYAVAFTRSQSLFFGTASLDEVYRSNTEMLALHRKHGDQEVIANQEFILHTLSRWRDAKASLAETLDPAVENFDVEAYAERFAARGNIVAHGYCAVLRQAQRYFDDDFESSVRIGLKFMGPAVDLLGILSDHMHRFFFMLAYLALDPRRLEWGEHSIATAYYYFCRTVFWISARNAPNYHSHVALIEAEEHRRAGRTVAALSSYERAITEAREVSRFNEALAYRRLALFYREQGLKLQAAMAARQAWVAYGAFGFRAEVQRLEREFPELAAAYEAPALRTARTRTVSSATSSSTFAQRLDVEAFARGAQAISSQVRLEGLVEALLRQLCQSSAAQRAVLLLQEGGALQIQGEMVVSRKEEELSVLQSIAFPSRRGSQSLVAETVVQFVARVRRTEVLGHASREGDFTQDPYVKQRELKSVLCKPILNQGKLLGVLYLENDLVAHAFTAEHQEVLEVLSSQAAISFENARLYRSLEQKVEDRTAELRRKTNDLNGMLQNLEQGVFTILEDGTIHREYSRQLESILGTRSIAGRDYVDVVFSDTTLSSDAVSLIKAAVGCSVGSELLWYEANCHLLVREMQRRRPDGSSSTLELNWSPILTDGDVVEKVLVSIKDVTGLRQLEQQAQDQRRDLDMIGQILAVPRSTFLEFLRDSDELVERSETLLGSPTLNAEVLAALFRNMHTIKGNARTYSFDALAQVAHDAEETYSDCRSAQTETGDTTRMQSDLAAMRECLQQYRRVYEHNLESFAGMSGQSTPVDNLLLDQIRAAVRASDSDELSSLVDAIGTSTMEDIVTGLSIGAREIARRLDKPAPNVRSRSTGVRFRPEIVSTLRDVFMHVLRNALDHGIESPAERTEYGKPESGEIMFSARPCAEGCEILIHDDGRGLNIANLRAIALREGLPADSDDELAELVFRSGITTCETVTDISGRGVGMDAIRRLVLEHGGEVQLKLGAKRGGDHRTFTTRIVLPRHYAIRLQASVASNSNGVDSELAPPNAAVNSG